MSQALPFIIIFLLLPLMIAVNTLIHELGHALAALLLTNSSVAIFIGSYGDAQSSVRVLPGRLQIWVNRKLLNWKGGLCTYAGGDISPNADIIITLAGPLASFLLFAGLLTNILVHHPQGTWGAFYTLFCWWAGLSFLYNIVPGRSNISLMEGSLIHNDGAKLKMLLAARKMTPEYHEAVAYHDNGQYGAAAVIFDNILRAGTKNEEIYRMAVSANLRLKNYRRADAIQKEQVAKIGNLNTMDRVNLALLKTMLGKYDDAINYYRILLKTGGDNKYNLNNFGYTLNIVEQYDEAIKYLDKAITIDGQFAHAYCNRAYAKMKLGRQDEGKKDNDISLSLDDKNAYAYMNEGIYLYEKGAYKEALEQFNKAEALDADTAFLQHYIQRTNNWIGRV